MAAVDCGTNSLRLLIADVDPAARSLTDVDRRLELVRLGQGVDATGRLAPEALDRTLRVLRHYASLITDAGVSAVRMAATSATRDAANAGEFVAGVRGVLGIDPEVLSGEEEARMSFTGATVELAGRAEPPCLVADIGGGSTEFVLGDPGPPCPPPAAGPPAGAGAGPPAAGSAAGPPAARTDAARAAAAGTAGGAGAAGPLGARIDAAGGGAARAGTAGTAAGGIAADGTAGAPALADAAVSVNIGCVRMTERHLRDDPPTGAQIAAARADIDAALDVVEDKIPVAHARTLVGLAGSVTTVAALALGLDSYQADRIHHSRIAVAAVREQTLRLLAQTRAERSKLAVMHPGRVDVIAGGALVLLRIMERFGFADVLVSEHDILDGLAWSLVQDVPR